MAKTGVGGAFIPHFGVVLYPRPPRYVVPVTVPKVHFGEWSCRWALPPMADGGVHLAVHGVDWVVPDWEMVVVVGGGGGVVMKYSGHKSKSMAYYTSWPTCPGACTVRWCPPLHERCRCSTDSNTSFCPPATVGRPPASTQPHRIRGVAHLWWWGRGLRCHCGVSWKSMCQGSTGEGRHTFSKAPLALSMQRTSGVPGRQGQRLEGVRTLWRIRWRGRPG